MRGQFQDCAHWSVTWIIRTLLSLINSLLQFSSMSKLIEEGENGLKTIDCLGIFM